MKFILSFIVVNLAISIQYAHIMVYFFPGVGPTLQLFKICVPHF